LSHEGLYLIWNQYFTRSKQTKSGLKPFNLCLN